MNKKELLKVYKWTISYFKPYLLHTTLFVLAGGMIIFGEIMLPRRMGYIIDSIIPKNSMSLLLNQIFFLALVVVLIIFAKMISGMLEQVISKKITRNMQKDLLKKYQSLGFPYYDRVSTGETISLFENAVNETQQTYSFLFPHFIYSLAQFVVPSVILLIQEPIFFFAAMVGNLLYVLSNHGTNKRIQKYLDIETKAAHHYQQSLYDTLSATQEMKAMGSEKWMLDKVRDNFNAYKEPRMKSILWRHIRFTIVGFTLTISTILVYISGLTMIQEGSLTLGTFIGYTFLIGLISRGFSVFFYIIPAQYHALTYAKGLYEFLNIHSERDSNNSSDLSLNQGIGLENVSFSYDDKKMIIDDLSLYIPKGQKVAFVGESGCGKSTLFKILGRFYDASGCIKFDGTDMKSFSKNAIRNKLGYVFQETFLFNTSIIDNIRFGKLDASDNEVIEAAKKAKAHDFIEDLESGYETIVGEHGTSLSGGQKQRIAIARMILKNPEILLLDEATSALDNTTELMIKETIDEVSKDKTVIAIAHRLSTIVDFDRIIVLDQGRIAEEGNYESLMSKKGLFYEFVLRGDSYAS